MRFVVPAKKQPKIFPAIKAGYDTLSSHIYLLLFPIVLDVFFLFGKRFLVTNQIEAIFSEIVLPPSTSVDALNSWNELSSVLMETFKNFSLTAFLRSFPIGIPSLLAFRPMEVNPLGIFSTVQVESYGTTLLYLIAFSLIGFFLGAFFLHMIRLSIQSKNPDLSIRQMLQQLFSLLALPVGLVLLGFFVLTPALLLISLLNAILPILGTMGYFFLSLVVISVAIPLLFTPQDILLFGNNFLNAARASIRTVRPTNGKTSIFVMLVFFTTYATNFLWQIPKDDSWMLVVSILGHALVTTLFYVASFHFYLDAHNCVRESLKTETQIDAQFGV